MQDFSGPTRVDSSTSVAPVEPSLAGELFARPSLAGQRLDVIERRAILDTLHATGGNKAKTSRMLGVSEKTIYNKLKQYRIGGKMTAER